VTLSTCRATFAPAPPAGTPQVQRLDLDWGFRERFQSSGSLNAAAVLRLDPETEVSKFLTLVSEAIRSMERIDERLAAKDFIGADDEFVASKKIITELLIYRDISDALGLVVFKCFQAEAAVAAITDAPTLPEMIKHALLRTWAAPFMEFDEACSLVEKIEDAAGSVVTPGYNELAAELIGDATVSDVQ
jgi:hypothetical protein